MKLLYQSDICIPMLIGILFTSQDMKPLEMSINRAMDANEIWG